MLNWPSHWLALVGPVQQTTYGMHDCSQGCTLDKEPKELAMRVREKNTNTEFAHLSTHTVYRHKIQFLRYFRGIWPYWKMDTGKHNFHEILLLFLNWAKRLKNSQWTPSPNAHWLAWCSMLRNLIRSEIWSCAYIFRTTLLLPSTATRADWNSKCPWYQWKNKIPQPA